MPASQTIRVRVEGFMTTITLDRPNVRNAMNIEMIRELISAFRESGGHDSIRIVVLRAEGPHFSAEALDRMSDLEDDQGFSAAADEVSDGGTRGRTGKGAGG